MAVLQTFLTVVFASKRMVIHMLTVHYLPGN